MQNDVTNSNIIEIIRSGTTTMGRFRVVEVDSETLMPVDRTICPACLSQPDMAGCKSCHGRPVCPGCRGAGAVSLASEQLQYVPCPVCRVSAVTEYGPTGWPHAELNPTLRQDAIQNERDRILRRRAELEEMETE